MRKFNNNVLKKWKKEKGNFSLPGFLKGVMNSNLFLLNVLQLVHQFHPVILNKLIQIDDLS